MDKIQSPPPSFRRIAYFDFLRGVAILMVIAIHTFPSDVTFDDWSGVLSIVIRQILNCAVPLFLAISGFFLSKKTFVSPKDKFSFWKRQIPSVYIPCLIWSVPYFILSILAPTHSMTVDVIMLFFCGFSVYYFVALIIQYYLLLPYLVKLNSKNGVLLCVLISLLSILFVNYLKYGVGCEIPLLVYAGPFPLWILFFVTGIYLAGETRSYRLELLGALLVIALVAQCADIYFFSSGFGIKLSSFVFSFLAILVLFSERLQKNYDRLAAYMKVVRYLGEISFGIYLIHCYFISALPRIFPYGGWAGRWLIVATLSAMTIYLVKKIAPKFSERYLGFR